MHNPVLIELTRGAQVESFHTGALAIARSNGEPVLSLGDIARPVYPRSAVKAFQTLAVLETGTGERFGFGQRELALLSASHSGTAEHTDLARDILRRAGHDQTSLGCGAHDPMQERAARELFKAGVQPSALHNNCSGKHAGMVAACVHCGEAVAGYWHPQHPHQLRIAAILHDVTGADVGPAAMGIDGCSAPNWAAPLSALARAFARFITGDGLVSTRATQCRAIADACMAEPGLVAGPGRFDTVAMGKFAGRIFMKTGAEGVYCGAFPDFGLGFALKIDDGNRRASEAVTELLLQRVFGAMARFGATGPIVNWREMQTGVTRGSDELTRALERWRVS